MRFQPLTLIQHDRRQFLLRIALGLWFGLATRGARAEARTFRVIVHAENPVGRASRSFVSDAFLKRVTRWSDGSQIRPVDQDPNSETRSQFSRSVLKKSVAAVRRYWQQKIFSGRGVPPPELETDREVVSYVRKHRGAIGYVSGGTKLQGVHELGIR